MITKAVNQYDKQGHYLRTFETVSEAKRMTGISTIFHTLRKDNPRSLAGGYQWRYDTGNHEDIPPAHVPGRPVIQINRVSGQVIQEFPSLAEAARAVGLRRQSIFMNCQGNTTKAGGFIWRYAERPEVVKNMHDAETVPEAKRTTPDEKKAAQASAAKKTQPKNPEVIIQSPMGDEITPEAILAKVGAVDKVYVRVDVNEAYWVKGEEYGDVNLW